MLIKNLMKEIKFWIDKEKVSQMYTADYWNNIEEDKKRILGKRFK